MNTKYLEGNHNKGMNIHKLLIVGTALILEGNHNSEILIKIVLLVGTALILEGNHNIVFNAKPPDVLYREVFIFLFLCEKCCKLCFWVVLLGQHVWKLARIFFVII
ncbi:hypothetical protein CGC48_09730 [Capnocytophaga cynodegmi]|uniref:Uncharacterized protein n=1 Tax=Capnocytophaga cynodegmi TaxID=28189 RepID=A0A250E7N4_9FLAO|nr:hypothetical protein CGC48_09730 [Capnocytophaga cynodegmi]